MSFWESIRVALTALQANKLRSLLTMLGVIIGVGSVIIMISIVQGARQKIVADFQGDGADVLFVAYAPKNEGGKQRASKFSGLHLSDVALIERRISAITGVSPTVEQSLKFLHGKREKSATCKGVTDAYLTVATEKLGRGRFIEESDGATWGKVCVLGDDLRKDLFAPDEDPLGQTVIIEADGLRIPLTVVGVMAHKGRSGFGESVDKQAYMPLQTLQKRVYGTDTIGSISARAANGQAESAADQVYTILKQRYPDHAKDFIVDTQEGLIKRLDTVLIIFQLILGGVGGLSLLVGGIGIMNIMLVSVTERTREIGIRKAIGAKQGDILLQFVTESMTVSGLGGLLGVAFGYGASKLVGALAGENLPTFVPLWAAGLGFGFAVGVGMFFGIYPAFRAARLDPIQALRYE